MRRRAQVDANQPAENEKLRALGYSVEVTSQLGQGKQDIIVGAPGVNLLVEWKLNNKSELTSDEEKFHREWKGPLIVATSAEQVHAEMVRLRGTK